MSKFTPIVRSEDGLNLQVWDPVKPCDPDKCPMSHRCKVLDQRKLLTGSTLCLWEQRYLKATAWLIIDDELGIGDRLNDAEKSTFANKATMLASQLIMYMKTMYGMEDDEAFPVDAKGKRYEHPVFKTMRDALNQYDRLMRDFDVYNLWEEKFGKKGKVPKAVRNMDFFERGDPSHHTRLMQTGANREEEKEKEKEKEEDGVHWKEKLRKQRSGANRHYVRKTIPKPGQIDGRGGPKGKPESKGKKKRGRPPKGDGKEKIHSSETQPDF